MMDRKDDFARQVRNDCLINNKNTFLLFIHYVSRPLSFNTLFYFVVHYFRFYLRNRQNGTKNAKRLGDNLKQPFNAHKSWWTRGFGTARPEKTVVGSFPKFKALINESVTLCLPVDDTAAAAAAAATLV